MKKWIIVGVVIFVLCFAAFTVWYYWPIHRSITMPICALDGETLVLEMNLTYHRSYFRPTTTTGTILCNGTEYIDKTRKWEQERVVVDSGKNFIQTFFDQFRHKLEWGDDPVLDDFVNAGLEFPYCSTDIIAFFDHTGGFDLEQVQLAYGRQDGVSAESSSKAFYGPAVTTEEAEALHAFFYQRYLERVRPEETVTPQGSASEPKTGTEVSASTQIHSAGTPAA